MPFSWNMMGKNRRISQVVNDHLHKSRKRRDGSSLVVETGFPTSLVDLFIKNREKLKKPSKKKRNKPPADEGSAPRSSSCEVGPSIPFVNNIPVAEVSSDSKIRVVAAESDGKSNNVFLFAFKLFLVVFLVLGTNELLIGVTVSAFLLFLVDFLWKCACKGLFITMARSIRRIPLLNKLEVDNNYKCWNVRQESSSEPVLNQEIELLDHSAFCSEIQPEYKPMSGSLSKGKSVRQEMEPKNEKDESIAKDGKVKKRDKIKSMVIKIFNKKSRSPSKKDSSPRKIEQEYGSPDGKESEIGSEHCDNVSAVGDVQPISETRDREAAKAKENGNMRMRYYFLALVILVGLVGGRPLAIFLALLWSLLLVYGEKLMEMMKLRFIWRYMDRSR